MESFDYVILGAGLGGLSAAACLSKQGFRVAVLEKHYLAGGCAHTFDDGDYRFCADLHYISQCGKGETIDLFFNYIDRHVPFNILDPDCIDRVITPDLDFKIPLGSENLRSRLHSTFPSETNAIELHCDDWDAREGAYYPRYHFKHLVDTIVEAITARGGLVQLSTPVEHIEVSDGCVQYLSAGGKVYRAEHAYISELDPKLTVELMHSSTALTEHECQRLTDYEYSTMGFNIYLGLDSRFEPERYGIGNWHMWYYPMGNLYTACQQQLQGNFDRPWIFLSCPTLKSAEPGIAPRGHHILEISTICPYESFKLSHQQDPLSYNAKKRAVYQQMMTSVRDLIPDVDRYVRSQVYGTPTQEYYCLGQSYGNVYSAKLIPQQVNFHRLCNTTELSNLFLVGASAGYPSVPGTIGNSMDLVDMLTGKSIWQGVGG